MLCTIPTMSALTQRLEAIDALSQPHTEQEKITFYSLLDEALALILQLSLSPELAQAALPAFEEMAGRWIRYWAQQEDEEISLFEKLDVFYASLPNQERIFFSYLLRVAQAYRPQHQRSVVYFKRAMACALQTVDQKVAEPLVAELLEAAFAHYQCASSQEIVNFWGELGVRCRARNMHFVAMRCFEQVANLCVTSHSPALQVSQIAGCYEEAAKACEQLGRSYYPRAAQLYFAAFRYAERQGHITSVKEVAFCEKAAHLYVNAEPPQYLQAAEYYEQASEANLKLQCKDIALRDLVWAQDAYKEEAKSTVAEEERLKLASGLQRIAGKCARLYSYVHAAQGLESAAHIYQGLSPSTIVPGHTQKVFELAAEMHGKAGLWLQAISCYEQCFQFTSDISCYQELIRSCWFSAFTPFLQVANPHLLSLKFSQLLDGISHIPREKREPLFVLSQLLGPRAQQDVGTILALTKVVADRAVSAEESHTIYGFLQLRPDVRDAADMVQLLKAMLTLPKPQRERIFSLIKNIRLPLGDEGSFVAIRGLIGLWQELADFPVDHLNIVVSFLEALKYHPINTIADLKRLVLLLAHKVDRGIPLEPILYQVKSKRITIAIEVANYLL